MAAEGKESTNFNVHRPDLFRPSSDPPPFKWPIWLEVMECYFQAAKIEQPRQKIIQLANNLGPLVLVEYIKCNRYGNAMKDSKISYEDFIKDCKLLFHKPPSPVRAHYDFNRAVQDQSESVQEYLFRLRTLAEDCEFDNRADYFIALQLVSGCCNNKVKEELLAEPVVDLNKFLERLLAAENATRDKKVMNDDIPSEFNDNCIGAVNTKVNISKKQPTKSTGKLCFGCGSPGHFLFDDTCPAKDIDCRRCGKKGHFAKRCRTKMVSAVHHIGSASKDFTVDACLVADSWCATLKMEVDTKSDITGIPKSAFY